jgi:quercetin dioxygenase-like cupin family protein
MIRILTAALILAATPAFADMGTPPAIPEAAAPARTVVTKLFSGTKTALGQDIVLPGGTAELTVLSYEIPPGARLPVHKHPHPRYAYVLAGRLKVSTGDDTRSFEYGPGDVIVEMLDAWHYGETLGSETVKLLVIDQAPPGETNTVLKQ